MIKIKNRIDCVGCDACNQICPKQCISMMADEQGFFYPYVETSKCIECGLCEKVCPVINQFDSKTPLQVFAGWNPDEHLRISSSSGGIFYELARKVLSNGGVVFGARFNDQWEVVHSFSETLEGISAFQGSKYVQSKIGQSYLDAQRFLKAGKKVLFSGTPCQIAGLKKFLRNDYHDALLTVDVVCHGVPSPKVWIDYLNSLFNQGESNISESQSFNQSISRLNCIKNISFRNKRLGWEHFGFSINYSKSETSNDSQAFSNNQINDSCELFEPFNKNLFLRGFLKDLYLRPSCYSCPAKCGKSHSDITLADFWGINNYHPELHSNEGISLLMANSEYGAKIITELDIPLFEATYEEAVAGNPAIIHSAKRPRKYEYFWNSYFKDGVIAIEKSIKVKMTRKIHNKLIRIVRSLLKH